MGRKYIIPFIACLTFLLGSIAIMVPFIPLGWFLYVVTVLLLIPYFKIFQRGFEWISRRDKTGFTKRALRFTAKIYRWARDHENADLFEKMSNEKDIRDNSDQT